MTKTTKKLWVFPWGYAETILILVAVMLAGYALQLAAGTINYNYLRWPVNGIAGLLLMGICVLAGSVFRHTACVRWFTSGVFAVSVMGALLVITVIMGLTPQTAVDAPHPHTILSMLGLHKMTACWPFVLLYVLLLLSLGTLTVRSMFPFVWAKYPFYLNHAGLWLVLFFMALGAADLKRYVMYVPLKGDNPEWRVFNDKNEMIELPIAIYLNNFTLEQYAPKLTVINRRTGKVVPESGAQYFPVDTLHRHGTMLNWDIHLLNYLPEAFGMNMNGYRKLSMPGSAPAVKVKVTNKEGMTHTGWISCGSIAQMFSKLDLDSLHSLVMTAPEPKRFASDVVVYSKDAARSDTAVIEVNKPLTIGHWMIYQYSYDEKAGNASSYSAFELVYDPWKHYVFGAFILLAAGCIALIRYTKLTK